MLGVCDLVLFYLIQSGLVFVGKNIFVFRFGAEINIQDVCFLAVVWLGNGIIAGCVSTLLFLGERGLLGISLPGWHAIVFFFSTSIWPLRSSIASGFL